LHIGNYFGALRQHIALQEEGEAFYFIANYHAMTSVQDPVHLSKQTFEVALDYLSLGLDPEKAVFFRQSDVPEVSELSWILSCVKGKGLLDRATSYKDKVQRGISPSMGLYTYPILMAADILIYRSNVVPVGEDQIQHIEMTRDIAQSFNNTYEEIFPLPSFRLDKGAKVPGIDGQKMSKSYGNTIEIFDDGKSLRKKIMSIVTDSTPVEEPKDPETCNVFSLFKLFADDNEQDSLRERYLAGGLGYGDAKKMLLEQLDSFFTPFRKEREKLKADKEYVNQVLKSGGEKAREEARKTMTSIYKAVGLSSR